MGIGNKWADEEKVLGKAIYISKIKKGKLLALLFALAEGKLLNELSWGEKGGTMAEK